MVTIRLKESVNVSLSAARLGMLTQREILMEELESQAVRASCKNMRVRLGALLSILSEPGKASMRRMMSAFLPAGDFEWRKPNFLQSISRPNHWFMRRPRQVIHHVTLAPLEAHYLQASRDDCHLAAS